MTDAFNKTIDYLRISVTENCNLRCIYCTPDKDINYIEEFLSLEELYEITDILIQSGIKKIRITGGEPLVRKGVISFINKICHHYLSPDVFITTNLNVPLKIVKALNRLPVNGINVSLDTLDPLVYKKITRYGDLNRIMENLENLKNRNIKTNTVVLKSVNEKEIEDIINYTTSMNIVPRFIECMEIFEDNKKFFISNKEIIKRMIDKGVIDEAGKKEIKGTAAFYFNLKNDSNKKIGFISPVSNKFCENCNRLRLTSKGNLHLCLFNKNVFDMNKVILKNISNEEKMDILRKVIKNKSIPEKVCYPINMRRIGG